MNSQSISVIPASAGMTLLFSMFTTGSLGAIHMLANVEILLSSNNEYERLIAQIQFKPDAASQFRGQILARITQETGSYRIEIAPPPAGLTWDFALEDFMETIQAAKEGLQRHTVKLPWDE